MSRARLAGAVALASLAALAGCGKTKATPPGVGFADPASVAVFRGKTIADRDVIHPYLAVANALRNDLTLVNANTDEAVLAPVKLRSLAIPVQYRPTLLVSAPLGDVDLNGDAIVLADLLVAVAGDSTLGGTGDSSLQLVRTWDAANDVVDAQTVEVAGEVLAAIAVPTTTPGTARLALALSDRRVAIVDYQRSGEEITKVGPPQVATLAVQPVALAASDDGAHVYAATPDEFTPGAGDYGVADIAVAGGAPGSVQRIAARGPTRLVAFARLRERVIGSAGSVAVDSSAFGLPSAPQPLVPRVYAVLDESGCGPTRPIDCGIAVLDPSTRSPREDVSRLASGLPAMPYLAPIHVPSRPLAIAVALPPQNAPGARTDANGAPTDAAVVYYAGPLDAEPTYHRDLMRLRPATGPLATTAVAAVACENGKVYFVDLGRWRLAVNENAVVGTRATVTLETPTASGAGTVRLSLADLDTGTSILAVSADPAAATPRYVRITPGYTRDAAFGVAYQPPLPSLATRKAEAGLVAAGRPWLAMQVTAGGSVAGQVVRLGDPSLGVKVGDTVEIDAATVPAGTTACVGTVAPGNAAGTKKVFEARVAALVPASAAAPGGAVELAKKAGVDDVPAPVPVDATDATVLQLWGDCFDALAEAAQAAAPAAVPNLTASILAGGLVVTIQEPGGGLEYLGRAVVGSAFTLEYPSAGEDAATNPDELLLARRARRFHHPADGCPDQACTDRFAGVAVPDAAGPAVKFRIALDARNGAAATPLRGLRLTVSTGTGVTALTGGLSNSGSTTHPNAVVPFDRSRDVPGGDYRFFVPYAGDWILDTTPSQPNAASSAIR